MVFIDNLIQLSAGFVFRMAKVKANQNYILCKIRYYFEDMTNT